MTDTTPTPTDEIDAVELPENLPTLNLTADPLDGLSVRELRVANGKLRADVVHAIMAPTADRWDAMALVGWLHAKRLDPTAKLDPWLDLSAAQLSKALRVVEVDKPPVDHVAAQLTETATIDDVLAEAREDPTVPTDGR